MQRLLKAWKELFRRSQITERSKAIAPYVLLNNRICQLQVLATHSEGLSRLSQQKTKVKVGGPHKSEEGMKTASFGHSTITNDALRYVTYFMFDRLHSLALSRSLNSEGEDWLELLRKAPEGSQPARVL